MNNTNQNHTDNFFKQGLSSPPELGPSDKNWKAMERLLKPETKRRSMAWIYPVSGIAAALLIFLSLWLVSEEPVTEGEHAQVASKSGKDAGTSNKNHSNLRSDNTGDIGTRHGRISPDEGGNITRSNIGETLLSENNSSAINRLETNSPLSISQPITLLNSARYLNIQRSYPDKFASQRNIGIASVPVNLTNDAVDKVRDPDSPAPNIPGKWALSMALSPDLNSVKGIKNSDFGVSLGMGVSYKLGKALSVGTGIYYSQKLYSADKTSYKVTEKPFATWTSYSKQIDADCRVLDVPLNLTLRMSNKTKNKLYATAGLSSYIMLSEKYDFIYNNPSPAYPTGRKEYTIHNQNKHILSVVNLGMALEKPLADQVSLVIQPYAKLPLTGIGQGQTDLKSFGVGFKLNYSLKKKNNFSGKRSLVTSNQE